MRARRGALPLRLWLVLAVLAITGAGFLAQLTMTAVIYGWQQQAAAAHLDAVRQVIGTDAARWRDPAWQRSAQAALADLGVDVAVFPASQSGTDGQMLFATAGARHLWDALSPSAADGAASSQSDQLAFQRMIIAGSPPSAPIAVAFLWSTRPLDGPLVHALWPVVELATFALTLAIVVWLIGQPVLHPLAEMSLAAEDIAGGDLHVRLPSSPVREIAEVSAALEGMSMSLRESLARQDALEHERRLFVGAVAHDLRTPLFMLRGSLKGLERGVVASPEKVARYIAVCQTQANVLDRLVSDLFAYTRLEHLDLEPEREPLHLGTLLRQAVDAATPLAAAKRIALTPDLATDEDVTLGDAHLLTRAVANLLDNAVRHTPEGGEIRVCTTRSGDQLIFSVADSGPGLAAHDLPHLFEPLYRGDSSRNHATGGVGLGLAIARRILEAHGGSLTAGNRAEGGAIFTGTVPGARAAAPVA